MRVEFRERVRGGRKLVKVDWNRKTRKEGSDARKEVKKRRRDKKGESGLKWKENYTWK